MKLTPRSLFVRRTILESPSVLIFPKGSDMLLGEKEERRSLVDKLYKLKIGTVLCCMVLLHFMYSLYLPLLLLSK